VIGSLEGDIHFLTDQFLRQAFRFQHLECNSEGSGRFIGVWLDDSRQPHDGSAEETHRRIGLRCLGERVAGQNQGERRKPKNKSHGFHSNSSEVPITKSNTFLDFTGVSQV